MASPYRCICSWNTTSICIEVVRFGVRKLVTAFKGRHLSRPDTSCGRESRGDKSPPIKALTSQRTPKLQAIAIAAGCIKAIDYLQGLPAYHVLHLEVFGNQRPRLGL